MKKLRFALPKGSLNNENRWNTEALLLQAGFDIKGYSPSSRSYAPKIKNDDELEAIVDRPQNMPPELNDGVFDLAILGSDIKEEWRLAGVDLARLCDLEYGYANLVVAVPASSQADNLGSYLREMSSKEALVCATEYPLITQDRISRNGAFRETFGEGKPVIVTKYGKRGNNPRLRIIESYGATESAVNPKNSADFVVETSSSGGTLKGNSLKAIETLIESSAGLYTTEAVLRDRWKKDKINYVRALLEGAVKARRTDYVVFNLPNEREKEMLEYLKRERLYTKTPTITRSGQYIQVGIEVPMSRWLQIFSALIDHGADDIIRLNPAKIISSG